MEVSNTGRSNQDNEDNLNDFTLTGNELMERNALKKSETTLSAVTAVTGVTEIPGLDLPITSPPIDEEKKNSALADLEEAHVAPSFVTQTDANGNPIHLTKISPKLQAPSQKAYCFGLTSCLFGNKQHNSKKSLKSATKSSNLEPAHNSIQLTYAEKDRIPLLPDLTTNKKCLVLDLDETLVHSSFAPVANPDLIMHLNLDNRIYDVYVMVRPGVADFLAELSQYYELVLFTASVEEYAIGITKMLEQGSRLDYQLYRRHCTFYDGSFVKDLSRLNRDLKDCIIVDNSPLSYQFHPENAIGVSSFIDNKKDRELIYCKEFLLSIKDAEDVREELHGYGEFVRESFFRDFPEIRAEYEKFERENASFQDESRGSL
eukprot:snap_masked-scaffold_1-processed-gene-29.11-mRNA-1 protein AED:0.37 eAED:0.37 QI:0/-1/0/1/-1/1/1/0/373